MWTIPSEHTSHVSSGPLRLATVSIAAAAALAVAPARADSRVGYLTTPDGTPVRAEAACVHTNEWAPGMRYRRCEPPLPHLAKATPAPVKAAPKPAARVVPPAPVPFKLSVDTLFDFDKAVLKPEGRVLLDKLAGRIGEARYSSISIVGHADRIGSESYNRSLSERRAHTVRSYLIARGLDGGKLSAWGEGSSEPMTSADQCRSLRGKRLIDCLAPDRYVALKTEGTTPTAALSRELQELESGRPAA